MLKGFEPVSYTHLKEAAEPLVRDEMILSVLSIPALAIHEPVVWGVDNEFYLSHDAKGEPDAYGCVFLDADNRLNDPLLIVYGHHVIGTNLRFSPLVDLINQPIDEISITFLDKSWLVKAVMQTSIASANDLFDPWTIDFVNADHFKAYLRYLGALSGQSFSAAEGKQEMCIRDSAALTDFYFNRAAGLQIFISKTVFIRNVFKDVLISMCFFFLKHTAFTAAFCCFHC